MSKGADGDSERILAALRSLHDSGISHLPAVSFHASLSERGFVRDAAALHLAARSSPRPAPGATVAGRFPDAAGKAPTPLAGVLETSRAIAHGEVSAEATLEHALSRIRAYPSLNAFVHLDADAARARARAVDSRRARGADLPSLAGVPIAHKDVLLTRGVPTEAGSALLSGLVPEVDAEVVTRLSGAGAISLGKLNTHEFATGVTGTVSAAGATANPWDRDRVPGGSSAGSAAAVALGLVSAATGTDTGGSIRIPAACCGVVGLKPTYGRVSRSGVVPFAWSLDHVGPLARTVRDVEALLRVMAADGEIGPPATDTSGLRGLRIGFMREVTDQACGAIVSLVTETVGELEHAGAVVLDVATPPTWSLVPAIALAVFLAEGGAYHHQALSRWPEQYQAATREFLSRAPLVTGSDYVAAMVLRQRLIEEFAKLLRRVDLLVLPTLPIVAPKVEDVRVELPAGRADVPAALTLFTRPFNLAGLPALSVPCGQSDGLPAAVQIVGRPFEEANVLRAGDHAARVHGCGPEPPGWIRT